VQEGKAGSTAFARTAEVAVGTPAAVIAFRREHGDDVFKDVTFVVVDEADLVLSYGHGADAHAALSAVPSTAQAILVSATLEADGLHELRKVVLRRPLVVKVTTRPEDDPAVLGAGNGCGVSHYFARLGSSLDRYLVTYAMLRLNVISGKVLVFTNHVNAAFRLKLFLDKFKLKSAVLNSELPANSRIHCVEQFNAGIFDILIATDELQQEKQRTGKDKAKQRNNKAEKKAESDDAESASEADDEAGGDEIAAPRHAELGEAKRSSQRGRHSKSRQGDAEFGVSRGVDFRGVAAVINFDFPESDTSYVHRAGRTGRAGASGTVLTLVVSDREQASVVKMGQSSQVHVGPLAFRMDQIEAFRYRVEDCLRSVTDAIVHDARLADVRKEMINSDLLKDYFEDNPMDLDALKHDGVLAKEVPAHLARVPAYLLPPALRETIPKETLVGGRPRSRSRGVRRGPKLGKKAGGDPLVTFSASGRKLGSSRERYKAKHGIKKKTPGRKNGGRKGTRK
jgi:ATP-dependent RNA helicase DDX56/DBP9